MPQPLLNSIPAIAKLPSVKARACVCTVDSEFPQKDRANAPDRRGPTEPTEASELLPSNAKAESATLKRLGVDTTPSRFAASAVIAGDCEPLEYEYSCAKV